MGPVAVDFLAGRGIEDVFGCIDDGDELTVRQFHDSAAMLAAVLGSRKALVAVLLDASAGSVLAYLALLQLGHAVVPVAAHAPVGTFLFLIDTLGVDAAILPTAGAVSIPEHWRTRTVVLGERPVTLARAAGLLRPRPLHEELALVMSTSGSLGGPKYVRLSFRNILVNAMAIADALDLHADRGITSLPLSYAYGLSVLHSHLVASSSVVLTPAAPTGLPFWRTARRLAITTFAGVPTTYRLLDARRHDFGLVPSIRIATVAGGALPPPIVHKLRDQFAASGTELVVMYGQTEATARISIARGELLDRHPGTVGHPVGDGTLWVRGRDGAPVGDGQCGEIIYRGPNVMMGYASDRQDLALGDVQGDELATGDLGHVQDGLLFITGRRARFTKLAGVRVSLDEIERRLGHIGEVAAVSAGDDDLTILVEGGLHAYAGPCADLVAAMRVPPEHVKLRSVLALPRTASGKIDYGMALGIAAP
jgi:acyl-CoA synthetase (AMP-forming)/AMP-acid ligase II